MDASHQKPASPVRRLAAIMFTDIVGYTAMMQENESAAAEVRNRHRTIFEQEHSRWHGEVLQYYGDGTLSVFKSAVEAVECAIKMQQAFREGLQVPLRIGIHLGDIVFDDKDVYGDGVNLASRVESMGVPGCVLISDKMNFAIKNHSQLSTVSVGQFEFKNIKDPVEVFAVSNTGVKVPERAELKGKLKESKKSIAVLPFVNMSSDPENEYFSDGISEEILNALVKVEGLQVTARTSSFAFKGKSMDVREIGAQLGAAHILEGSVRKAGNRVRVTAQLVSTVDGYHFFSESYDRTLEDIFEVQDEIATTITNRLRQHLTDKQHEEKMVTAPTLNMEAYETYLRGLFYANQFGDDAAMSKAIPYFERAIEMEPDFVLPYERLGICYFFQTMGGKVSIEDARAKISHVFGKLKQLGIESASGYFAIAVYNIFVVWDFKTATDLAKKGLEKFPNSASLYHVASTLYWINGDLPAIARTHKKGLDLDPLSIEMIFYMGVAYLWNKQFEKAMFYLEKVLKMVPHHRAAREYTGWIHFFHGRFQQALTIFEQLEPFGYRLHRSTCLGCVYFKMEELEKAETYLQEMVELEKEFVNFSLDLAEMYTCFGNFDLAFQYLEKSIRHKVGDSMMLRSNIFLNPLKEDDRFEKMEALIGEMPTINF